MTPLEHFIAMLSNSAVAYMEMWTGQHFVVIAMGIAMIFDRNQFFVHMGKLVTVQSITAQQPLGIRAPALDLEYETKFKEWNQTHGKTLEQ